jgi:hypothetical protein
MIDISSVACVRIDCTSAVARSAEAVAGGGAAARDRRVFGLAGALSSLCDRVGRFAMVSFSPNNCKLFFQITR